MHVVLHNIIPNFFSNIWRFWYQKLSHIYKTLVVKFHVHIPCSLEEISENLPWKLESVVTTLNKTISNIKIDFSNYVKTRYIFVPVSLWMGYLIENLSNR